MKKIIQSPQEDIILERDSRSVRLMDSILDLQSNKADKVQNAVDGNLAGLDANGNLTDSGYAPSDFALSSETPVKLVVDDITQLTSEQVASLGIGDIVAMLSAEGYAYIVEQKDVFQCQLVHWYDGHTVVVWYTCYDNTWSYYMTETHDYAYSESTPCFITSSNITSVLSASINALRIGDFVHVSNKDYVISKKTSSECHFVYVDSSYIEDIKYTKTGNIWSYSGTTNISLSDIADISNKADKVQNAISGNFAGLDNNGNLTDSGYKPSDFATASQGVPSGGTSVQILAKHSDTDYDTEWINQTTITFRQW